MLIVEVSTRGSLNDEVLATVTGVGLFVTAADTQMLIQDEPARVAEVLVEVN